jgi:Fe-S oxidoreductase/nitrate reductase gamma subunit
MKNIKRVILDSILGIRLIQGDIYAGIMHMLIFWGFLLLLLGTLLLAIHEYLFSFLTGTIYLVFSLVMEIGGIMFMGGGIWALIRRYFQRINRLERRLEDALVLIWLLILGLSGFLLEGIRLTYQDPSWGEWSFIGSGITFIFSPVYAREIYPYFWWAHAIFALSFIAVIPFTKLFHILSAPVSVYLNADHSNKPLELENSGEFTLSDSIYFDACMRCGRCVDVCPSWGAGEPFNPRDFIQSIRHLIWQRHSPLGDIRFFIRDMKNEVNEKLWYCTTCRACLEVCPIYGPAFEIITKKRIQAVEDGTNLPKLLNQTLEKLFKYDNPWEPSRKNRGAWAEGLDIVKIPGKGNEVNICYFVGCTTSFDTTAMTIARSFSKILKVAGINFGILAEKEPCCGDIARRTGEVGLSIEQMEKCIDIFDQYNINQVVTSSPHCYHIFKNEYPETRFRTRHYIHILNELIRTGTLNLKKEIKAKVTYHDPCYLGRYNRIFDQPREIISSIPGISLVEMKHNRANSLCCGGGGGRMWQDPGNESKMSSIRIKEATATGAEILLTACPLCRIMLEDARKAEGVNDVIQVMDINELILKTME